jgi:hypothetical protein
VKIALLSREDPSSPRVLAEALSAHLKRLNIDVELFFGIDFLRRLKEPATREWSPPHIASFRSLRDAARDALLIRKLRAYDAVILCDYIPTAFHRNDYKIESLRESLQKPIVLYEVLYLGSTPFQERKLRAANEPGVERYDWHLSVSPIGDEVEIVSGRWSCIGLNLSEMGLVPPAVKKFEALLDFPQPGYELYRDQQTRILSELQIPTKSLSGQYSISNIRSLYQQAAVFFTQTPESFGVPIAECFAMGTRVLVPKITWARAWRVKDTDNNDRLLNPFIVYDSWDDLRTKLINERERFDSTETAQTIAAQFKLNYPRYFFGDTERLMEALEKIKSLA